MRNVYQEITDKILSAMESGNLPWIKPWSGIGTNNMPRNAITKRAYSGCNVPLLWLSAQTKGYARNDWLTYKQAQEIGAQVRSGEKATMVVFASTFITKPKEGEDVKRVPFLKAYSVFNTAQCDNVPATLDPKPINTEQRNADCEAFLRSTLADIRHGEGRAYYRPTGDFIMLPAYETFKTADGYYGTALHELTHWTGIERRCNRQFGKRFGDKAYAAEELVAELGAAFMCAEFGFDAITQHAAYIKDWIALLKDDARAFVTAASKASQAVEFLRGLAISETTQLAA